MKIHFFQVELVFYVDANNIVRDNEKTAGASNILTNHRPTLQSLVRLPTTQSNNYSLPQNNSSGSEMNFICDQKSSSSTSVSSSLGGATTDNSNGYESNSKRSTQNRSGVQHFSNTHHSQHPYMAMHDDNSVLFTSPPPQLLSVATTETTTATTTPPGFVTDHDNPQAKHQNQFHKNNVHHHHHLQHQSKVPSVTATSTPNQRHTPRQSGGAGGGAGSGGVVGGTQTGMDVMCQISASANLNATSSNTSYNHSTNSSKTSSVSSQSSSAIGDNEEDWESGESSAKQLDHITLLLSTSSVTTSPAPTRLLPNNNNTNINLSPKDSPRSKQKINTDIHPSTSPTSSSTFTSTSVSASTCTSTSSTSHLIPKYPYNKCNTISSSCKNRVAGGDDDDDDDNDNENVDEGKFISMNLKSNSVVKQQDVSKTIPAVTASVNVNVNSKSSESNKGVSQSAAETTVECSDPNKNAISLSIATQQQHGSRPKLMHLLLAPKQTNATQSTHKQIFKRKSSYKLMKSLSNTAGRSATSDSVQTSSGDAMQFESDATDPVVGSFGGVATSSKQKLKIKLKKNKLKLSQKFQWFQSYFRSDPVDFCENFVQQTTSLRRNSICSMASRTHKLSTTTPPSVTPPPLAGTTDGSLSCEQLNDRGAVSVSESTSNTSIATGDLCEDYYSYICDNQLSFSNSPCKSPRSMADIVGSISGNGAVIGGGSYGSSFAKSAGSFHQHYFRERRETLPGLSAHNTRRSNVVIVAAKPARTNAIGFLPAVTNFDKLSMQDSPDVDASPASIYNTASCSPIVNSGESDSGDHQNKNTPFVFPHDHSSAALDDFSCDNTRQSSATKPLTKYSLNLVIVKECPSESSVATSAAKSSHCDDVDSDICCDHDQNVSSTMHSMSTEEECSNTVMSAIDDMLEAKATAATCASICSNSSSSGFCTSECCTTNSSSSSCNCNPFAVVLDRHAALASTNNTMQQDQKQNIIHEVIENSNTTPPKDDENISLNSKSEANDNDCDQ